MPRRRSLRPASTAGTTARWRSRTSALALCQADTALVPLGFRALLMLMDEAVSRDRLNLARRTLHAASERVTGLRGHVAFLEAEWLRRHATLLALEGHLDEAITEFRRGIALWERQGWYLGFAYVELLVGLAALCAQIGQKQRAGRANR